MLDVAVIWKPCLIIPVNMHMYLSVYTKNVTQQIISVFFYYNALITSYFYMHVLTEVYLNKI